MKITIIGLGYVGITSAACFLKLGHEVIGIEKNSSKINALLQDDIPITEPDISSLICDNKEFIRYKSSIDEDINNSDIVFICVGTPTDSDNTTDLSAIYSVFEELSHVVVSNLPIVIRSTVPIGTTTILSNMYDDLNLIFHPEFLREGSAVTDFFNPPKIVIGSQLPNNIDVFSELYNGIKAETFMVDYETAESIKYTDNIWHALKISFTNEISKCLSKKGACPHQVMKIFCTDKILNLSSYYMKPGFAYGGSCLEKDLSSFRNQFNSTNTPLLNSISVSNKALIDEFCNSIRNVGDVFVVDGITFKEFVDDLRRSPFVSICNFLLNNNKKVFVFDSNLNTVFGESKEILEELLTSENFYLNVDEINVDVHCIIKCHKNSHINYEIPYKKSYELFVGGNVAKNFL